MNLQVIQFLIRVACEYDPEKLNRLWREIIQAVPPEDRKSVVATLGNALGAYDPSTGKLKRKFRCLEFDKICDSCKMNLDESGEYILINASPDVNLLKVRDKYGLVKLAEIMGEEGIEELVRIATRIVSSPQEGRYILRNIERLRDTVDYLIDHNVMETDNGVIITLVYVFPEDVEEYVKKNGPGLISNIYANILAKIRGYQGAKFKGAKLDGNALNLIFEFYRS